MLADLLTIPSKRAYLLRLPFEFSTKKYCSTKTAATSLNGNGKREQRLVVCPFGFLYSFSGSGNDRQIFLVHAVKQRVELPPLRGLLRVLF